MIEVEEDPSRKTSGKGGSWGKVVWMDVRAEMKGTSNWSPTQFFPERTFPLLLTRAWFLKN